MIHNEVQTFFEVVFNTLDALFSTKYSLAVITIFIANLKRKLLKNQMLFHQGLGLIVL